MAREKTPRADDAGEPGFEGSMNELERIVEELEGGQLTLDQSLGHYEKGMALAKQLTTTLDQAEKRIEKLVESDATGGTPRTEPMTEEKPGRAGEGELPF